jgi:hypothetical protein
MLLKGVKVIMGPDTQRTPPLSKTLAFKGLLKAIPIGVASGFAGLACGWKDFFGEVDLYGARFPGQPFPWRDIRFVWTLIPPMSRFLIAASVPILMSGVFWSVYKRMPRKVATNS